MNNPGIDLVTWERLRNKWTELHSTGNKLEIEFRLIADPKDENNILAIDVIQNINDDVLTETVQRNAREAYATLGIDGLSMEALVEAFKNMMRKLHSQTNQKELDLVVTMSPTSSTSGEIKGYVGRENSDVRSSVPVNYRHYYLLNVLREKMVGLVGDSWTDVKAVYRSGDLEFYFEYH
jgi:hypothetical protein